MTDEATGPDDLVLRISKNEPTTRHKCLIFCKAKRFVWPASVCIVMAVFGFLAINTKLAGREQRQRLKAFEKGHRFLAKAGELYLEDYVHLSSVMPQPDLHRLELSTTFMNKSMDTEHIRNYYRSSVRHLHKAAPMLEEVDLISGYLFNPGKKQITNELLKAEIEGLKENLFAVQDAFTQANITIRLFSFDAVFAIDREEAEQANYQQILSDQLQYQADRISVYYMKFPIPIRRHRTEILLNLSFEPKLKSRALGRQRFLTFLSGKTDGPNSVPVETKLVL